MGFSRTHSACAVEQHVPLVGRSWRVHASTSACRVLWFYDDIETLALSLVVGYISYLVSHHAGLLIPLLLAHHKHPRVFQPQR